MAVRFVGKDNKALSVKKWAYCAFIFPSSLPLLMWLLAGRIGHYDVLAWFPVFFFFGVIPLIDYWVGEEQAVVPEYSGERSLWLTVLPLLAVPLQTALCFFVAYLYFYDAHYSALGQAGLLVSLGVINGANNINIAHELIHKDSVLERFCGGFLLSQVGYAGFKIEHIRGHHVDVSTPKDASSAPFNRGLYHFLPHAIFHNVMNAWTLEVIRLERKQLPVFSWHNEMIRWYVLTLSWIGLLVWVFGSGAILFFFVYALIAIVELEIINYIEHYGLERKQLDNGRYERTTPVHSWNSSYLLTNLLLFQLQRHSDHHSWPKRPYEYLRHHENAPQLPAGYGTMVLLALVPPLWKRVMNPRVKQWIHHLDQQEGKR